jgi:hypothetical protein
MDDLDTLQMELETLLNCVVLRSLNLQREIAGMTEKVFIKVFFHLVSIICLLTTLLCFFSLHLLENDQNKKSVHLKSSKINQESLEMHTHLHF